ncbi:MAG: hypothetical protein WKF84_20010 [Pyrinomonadaceae bacterium]
MSFNKRLELPKYSRMVPFEEIETQRFQPQHPALHRRPADRRHPRHRRPFARRHSRDGRGSASELLGRMPAVAAALFADNRPNYLDLSVAKEAIKPTIYGHPEFVAFIDSMNARFAEWREQSARALRGLQIGFHPKQTIVDLSEDLLRHYTNQPLIDKYDVYQHLMNYWAETMQDDCYLIAIDGWKAETVRVLVKTNKGKEVDKGWTCDLVPKHLIVARYFAAEQEAITKLEAELETVTARMGEMEEEHGGDEGLFSELDKVNKATVTARLRDLRFESGESVAEEKAVLEKYLELSNQQIELKRALKEAEDKLDALAYNKYPTLTEDEIKTLVVNDKWLAALDAVVHGEMDSISQALTVQ